MAQVERATSDNGKVYLTETDNRTDIVGESIKIPVYQAISLADRNAQFGYRGFMFGKDVPSKAYITTTDLQFSLSGTVGVPANEYIETIFQGGNNFNLKAGILNLTSTDTSAVTGVAINSNGADMSINQGTGKTLWIGASSSYLNSDSIYDSTTANAANVHINNALFNRVQRSTSARKYKKDIEPIETQRAIDFIEKAQPIWYRSKCETDNQNYSYYGYIADDVAEFEPRLVNFNQDGEPEGFAYERVTALLHVYIKEQDKTIKDLQERIERLEAKLNETT